MNEKNKNVNRNKRSSFYFSVYYFEKTRMAEGVVGAVGRRALGSRRRGGDASSHCGSHWILLKGVEHTSGLSKRSGGWLMIVSQVYFWEINLHLALCLDSLYFDAREASGSRKWPSGYLDECWSRSGGLWGESMQCQRPVLKCSPCICS